MSAPLARRTAMGWLALAVVGLAALTAACGGGADDGSAPAVSEVTVNLANWAVEPSANTLAAGDVTFTAVHDADHAHGDVGGATHQLVVAPLPAGANAGESKFGAPVVNLEGLEPGESRTVSAKLAPGIYELACLVVEEVDGKTINHYQKGMYARVTVK